MGMAERTKTAPQNTAVKAVERTFTGMKLNKYWERVIRSVAPKAEANERIRAKSLAKAGNHVLR